jgi:hypothetical protein
MYLIKSVINHKTMVFGKFCLSKGTIWDESGCMTFTVVKFRE